MPFPPLPANKTKVVCTIGPASESPDMLEKLIRAGMNIARLNFSHGEFSHHGEIIARIRRAAEVCNRRVAIMADLPGPKIRIGELEEQPVHLEIGDHFTLTVKESMGNKSRAYASLPNLTQVVSPGHILFLNDGLIQLKVVQVQGDDVVCEVVMGGLLRSRKGLNLPGIDLGFSAFTDHDRACMQYALDHGVDAVSQSFVNSAGDINDVRQAAAEMGYDPFIIAKIERSTIHEKIDEILEVADGVMVARGDLGVEIPIEQIAVTQKFITGRANLFGKPVITATQMLESMTHNRRPTRAEATDVANAILDGTDCVMLSEESAMGDYPIEATEMLVKIAASTEPHRGRQKAVSRTECRHNPVITEVDYIALSVKSIVEQNDTVAAILAPTDSGATARRLARFRLPTWILGVSQNEKTCRELVFSYGVFPFLEINHPADWTDYARDYAIQFGLEGSCIIQTEGPSPMNQHQNHKMEIIDLNAIR